MDFSIDDCDARIFRYYEDFNGIDPRIIKGDRKPQRTGTTRTAATPAAAPVSPPPSSTFGSKRATRSPRPPPVDGCLVFKGPHWLKDCLTATESQREDAKKKFREAKEHARAHSGPRLHGTQRPQGLYSPCLSNAVEAVMADGRVQLCDQEVLLDLELTTLAGQVSLHSVACLILEGAGDEFMLGRDVLKGLGIDVEQQLAQLAGPPLLDDEVDQFPVGHGIPEPQADPGCADSLTQLIDRAVANGLPSEHVDKLREIIEAHHDVWRESVGPDPPANVEPLRITLTADAVPYRSPPRKYAPLQAQFIRNYVKTLVASGLVRQNNASRWARAVVPVRKPGTQDQFRLTIDYRPVNSMTVPIAGTMPSAATTIDAFMNKKVFGRVDVTQGFWQNAPG
ncbi:unnamed protein product [Phytophthora fragariaefolia]|uniref:Unnamed protein product n=1 Tax=Phytophthora fragariaefolia TaxID=1490495 RepID=A0A9W6XMQ8_9STRA|nr:unnamed protein product [Phytophthora fragariaefolia]